MELLHLSLTLVDEQHLRRDARGCGLGIGISFYREIPLDDLVIFASRSKDSRICRMPLQRCDRGGVVLEGCHGNTSEEVKIQRLKVHKERVTYLTITEIHVFATVSIPPHTQVKFPDIENLTTILPPHLHLTHTPFITS